MANNTEWKRVEKEPSPTRPPAPRTPAHVAEDERKLELLRKVRQTYQDYLSNAAGVRPKPGKMLNPEWTYVWVNTHQSRIVFYRTFGYEIVHSAPGQADEDVETNWQQADGTHVWGDVILMKIPRELKEALDLNFQLKSLDELTTPSEFEQYAGKHGVPVTRTVA